MVAYHRPSPFPPYFPTHIIMAITLAGHKLVAKDQGRMQLNYSGGGILKLDFNNGMEYLPELVIKPFSRNNGGL